MSPYAKENSGIPDYNLMFLKASLVQKAGDPDEEEGTEEWEIVDSPE